MRKTITYIYSQTCRVIGMLGLVCGMLCGFASCHWQEAKGVIAMADSIDQNHHVIYDDTAALGQTIRTLDNPLGRLLMSNTLGKAYYYMGRNLEDSYQQVVEAAECYIEADRLQIDDPIYRGRVNACMGYICSLNNNDSLSLIFYERANDDFKESGNEWRYAQMLLTVAYHRINLHQFVIADSLLHIAQTYPLDRAYQARYYETCGLYFYELHQYDSALVYFERGLDCWPSDEDRCFSYLKIMQVYFDLNVLEQAIPYAQYIVNSSNNPNYLVNAYYCLLLNAKAQHNTDLLSKYSHAREDANRQLESLSVSYSLATQKIEGYNLNPYSMRWVWFVLFACVVLFVILVISLLVYRRFANAQLQVSNEQIVSLSAQLDSQQDELNEHTKLHIYDKRLASIRKKYPTPSKKWNKYDLLKGDINSYLRNWLAALDQLSLTNRDKVYCVLSFIYPHMSAEELAKYMCVTKDAVLVRKARIVKKLQITSEQFGSFLLNLSKK